MAPVIAEVEREGELIARFQLTADFELGVVLPDQLGSEFVAREADSTPVGELELVQVGEVPARERLVDRIGELLEGVAGGDDQDATGWRIEAKRVADPARGWRVNEDRGLPQAALCPRLMGLGNRFD